MSNRFLLLLARDEQGGPSNTDGDTVRLRRDATADIPHHRGTCTLLSEICSVPVVLKIHVVGWAIEQASGLVR